MNKTPKRRIVVIVIALAALVAVGLALANAPSAPPARKAPKRKVAAGELDCKALEKQLNACSLTITQAFDPKLPDRLAKHPEQLRQSLKTTITQEFIARVLNPCIMRKGKVDQGALLQQCLDAAARKAGAATCPKTGAAAKPKGCKRWKQAQQCQALAACLKAKARKLPKPKPVGKSR